VPYAYGSRPISAVQPLTILAYGFSPLVQAVHLFFYGNHGHERHQNRDFSAWFDVHCIKFYVFTQSGPETYVQIYHRNKAEKANGS